MDEKVRQIYPLAEYVFSRNNDSSTVFAREAFFSSFFSYLLLNLENLGGRELLGTTTYKSSMVADEHSRLRLSGEMAKFLSFGSFSLLYCLICVTFGLLSLAGMDGN